MRDEKKFQSGEDLKTEPRLFLGAAENPFADPFQYRAASTGKENKGRSRFYSNTNHL